MRNNIGYSMISCLKRDIKKITFIYNITKKIHDFYITRSHKQNILDWNHINKNYFDIIYSIKGKFECSYAPKYWPTSEFPNEKRYLPDINLMLVKNGIVIGGSNIVLLNKTQGFYNHNYDSEVNCSDSALYDYYHEYYINKKVKIYEKRRGKRLKINEAVSFCINYSFNYYHYILECLSKFYILEKSTLRKNIPILIDSSAKYFKQFDELLCIFNRDNREVIYVDSLQYIKVNNLYLISTIQYIPTNYININSLHASSITLNFNSLKFLRTSIVRNFKEKLSSIPKNKNIFISRKNNHNRNYNNDEIEEYLKRRGFEVIQPELMSLEEQVKSFYNAKIIIAASGAALTNIIFCRPQTKIIVLFNNKLNLSIFSNIANCFKLDMMYLTGDSSEYSIHSSFKIELKNLEEILGNIMN